MSAIKDFFDADRADFISLRELLAAMCKRENCSPQEAARFLSRITSRVGESLWSLYKPLSGLTKIKGIDLSTTQVAFHNLCDGDHREESLLSQVEAGGQPSRYDIVGFRKSEILPLLAAHGIALALDGRSQVPVDLPVDDVPEWRKVMARRKRLTDFEVTCLLAGLNPVTDKGNLEKGSAVKADFGMHRTVLDEALDVGDLPSKKRTIPGPNFDVERIIKVTDLIAWCDRNNIPRPLPWNFDRLQTGTDSELRKQNEDLQRSLTEMREEAARLQIEVSSLKSELAKMKADQPIQQRARQGGLQFLHETRLLRLVANAQERYAGENLNILDRDTWPRKDDVVDWLQKKEAGLSKKTAEVIDTIAMPFSRGK